MLPPVAILAGGLSTRMYPVTRTIPKALLEVAGEPFITHQLRLLKSKGISGVVLCVGNMGDLIEKFVGDGSAYGLSVRYSYDGEKLLGTGGAIKKALPKLGNEFFIMYGDSYLTADLAEIDEGYRKSGKPAMMAVFRNKNLWDTSNVIFREGKVIKYDKLERSPEMEYIDYGLAIIKAECFSGVREGEVSELADIYKELAAGGKLAGCEVSERFYEIGSFTGLEELNTVLGGKK